MPTYTEEDVHVEWVPGGKHHKKRKSLPLLNSPEDFFNNALRGNKAIIVKAFNIRKSKSSISRYTINLIVGYRQDFEFKDPKIFINYWRLWPYATPPEETMIASRYLPAPFSNIHAILPCSKFTNNSQPVSEYLRAPRVSLFPRYGDAYVYNLDTSINSDDLACWMPIVNLAVQKVHKQFVDENGEIV